MLTGHITDWNPDRGFGYVETDGDRLFLHKKDFAERHKKPEVGDKIRFEKGEDKQGRPCAQKAVHVNDGGRVTSEAILFLLLLVGPPICAIVALSGVVPPVYPAVYWLAVSISTYAVYAWDKRRARGKGKRGPERLLHLLEVLGGWPGAFIAQRRLRHKCSKVSYQITFWLIVAFHQYVAIDYLRGWSMTGRMAHAFKMMLA
jgi:uncharacterized membrane protein YsdA (DUF1294 family)/cold shock CspA family protein